MSSRILLASNSAMRTIVLARRQTLARRTITTSSHLCHKESDGHTPPDLEKHKQDSLSKHKKGTAHWKPELASDSEESVKADRHPDAGDGSEEAMRRLQERTKRAAEETTKAGTSMRDGL